MTDELTVRKSILVDCGIETAFRVFTEKTAEWWPFEGHSLFDDDTEHVVFEGRAGGRVYERSRSGEEGLWGTLTSWEPPHAFAMTWHPGREAETGQQLEVRFAAEGGGTRVDLLHSGFERRGADAEGVRSSYDSGWDTVLDLFADAARQER
jgi:hypothetical protein